MGLVLSDLTDEQKKEAELKSGVLVEDVAPTVRGNVQPGDIIIAIVKGGASTEAKTAAQVNDLLGEARQGRLGHVADEARRQQFFATLRMTMANRRMIRRSASADAGLRAADACIDHARTVICATTMQRGACGRCAAASTARTR